MRATRFQLAAAIPSRFRKAGGDVIKLLTRADWGATYDVNQRPAMALPVRKAFCHHSVTNATTDAAADMRFIEHIDIGRFGYPSYSWVIHPTGVVLEGMGTHVGAHTKGNNSTSFGICLIGNFENDTPTDAALEACATLLAARIAQGHLTADFELGGHRDVFATACPGANLYPLIGQIRANVTPEEDDLTPELEARFDAIDLRLTDIRNQIGESNAQVQTGLAGALHKARVAIKRTFTAAGGTGDPEA